MMKTPGYYYYCLYQKQKTNKENPPPKKTPQQQQTNPHTKIKQTYKNPNNYQDECFQRSSITIALF